MWSHESKFAILLRQDDATARQARDIHGDTALHWAAWEGHDKLVAQLLAHDPKLADVLGSKDRPALECAVLAGHDKIVSMLLECTSVELVCAKKGNKEWDALDWALAKGFHTIVVLLLDYHPRLLHSVNFIGFSGLYTAAKRGHSKAIAALLARKPKLPLAQVGYTPLSAAAERGHVNIVAQLLQYGPALSEIVRITGHTVLHDAADQKVVELLLAHNPNLIDAVTSDGHTALHYAAMRGNYEVVAQLLTRRPELIDLQNAKDQTALHLAISHNKDSVVDLLFAIMPEQVHHLDRNQNTLLHHAVAKGDTVLETVYKRNVEAARAKNAKNHTPMHIAAQLDNKFAIRLMQGRFSVDELMNEYKLRLELLQYAQPIIERQCEELVAGSLNRDVIGIVYEYVGTRVVQVEEL